MLSIIRTIHLILIAFSSYIARAADGNQLQYLYEKESIAYDCSIYIDQEDRNELISSISRHRMIGVLQEENRGNTGDIKTQVTRRVENLGKISSDMLEYSRLQRFEIIPISPIKEISTDRDEREIETEPLQTSTLLQKISDIGELLEKQELVDGLRKLALLPKSTEHHSEIAIRNTYFSLKNTYFEDGVLRMKPHLNRAPLTVKDPFINPTTKKIEHYLLNICIAYHQKTCETHYSLMAIMAILDDNLLFDFKTLAKSLAKPDTDLNDFVRKRLLTSEKFQTLKKLYTRAENKDEILSQLSLSLQKRYRIHWMQFQKIVTSKISLLLQET
ncbi:MAG: hypothetical protein KA436_06760 [Oligoflexales bacterium]|nr:hypothetical protein [Oligoflexales bacterium]